MNIEAFEKLYNKFKETDDKNLLNTLKESDEKFEEPYMFEAMSFLFSENGEISNHNEMKKYQKLAFEAYKSHAENGNFDHMSKLAEFYTLGIGTVLNNEKAEYWMDKLYLEKTGMKYKEWIKKNA